MINVHTFDGKLKDIFKPDTLFDIDHKIQKFTSLINFLTDSNAIQSVNNIISDLPKDYGPNYQPENDIDASDILMSLLQHIENKDLIILLNEQLADITTLGTCPSGRVTRLLQLHNAFIN